MKNTKVKIEEKTIKINSCVILVNSPEISIINVDLADRYATIDSTGNDENDCPIISIEPETENTLTSITFLDFPGWSIWSAQISKYTLKISLVKNTVFNCEL